METKERVKYEITIKKTRVWKEEVTKNYLLKETPTAIVKGGSYGSNEVQYQKEYSGPMKAEEEKTDSSEILTLEVKEIDLKQVVDAILGTKQGK